MNRRSFLAALGAAPVVAAGAVAAAEAAANDHLCNVLVSADLPVAPDYPVDIEQLAAVVQDFQMWLQEENRLAIKDMDASKITAGPVMADLQPGDYIRVKGYNLQQVLGAGRFRVIDKL